MELPLGETAAIAVTSSDVNHAFWIPDMLFKRDAIPGRVTSFDLTPSKLGTFLGRCGEFCGLDHALMTFSVRVVPPAELPALARLRGDAMSERHDILSWFTSTDHKRVGILYMGTSCCFCSWPDSLRC